MKTKVHFWELPNKIHVILKPQFRDILMKRFMKIAKTKYGANKLTGISRPTISKIINKPNCKIKIDFILIFIKLINENKFNLNNLEKNIIWIGDFRSKGVNNPKLPFNFNSREGSRFLAAVCNEGWISDGAYYSNSEQELRNSVKNDAIYVFGGDNFTIREWVKDKDQYLAFPSIIRDTLNIMTKFKGIKSEHNPPIPSVIFKNKNNMYGWIEQTIADEGHVKFQKDKYRRSIIWTRSIDITKETKNFKIRGKSFNKLPKNIQKNVINKKFNLIEGEYKILNLLRINHNKHNNDIYITKKGKIKLRVQTHLTCRENLLKLRKLIKIPLKRKEQTFTKMMGGFVRYKEPLKVKEAIKKIYKKNGCVTSPELKKEMNYKELGTATKWLKFYLKEGLLKCLKEYSYGNSIGRTAAKYELNQP